MSNPYIVSKDSVITSLFVQSSKSFLTCGGTNIKPKVGIEWVDFNANGTNFKYIFNSASFSSTPPEPTVTGYSSTATAPTTIKQFLYNGANIEYVCGEFSLITPTCTNIMYFDPLDTNITKDATFKTLDVTFTEDPALTDITVNCMSPSLTGAYTKIFIAGKFATATAAVAPIGPSTGQNMALLNVSTDPTWSIDTSFSTVGTLINDNTTTINSMVVFKNILYIGGTNNNNCLFYKYNGTSFTNLLGGSYAGTINVLEIISNKSQIAIGGRFLTLGTATNCNNIVRYDISQSTWIALGVGVSGIGAGITPIYNDPEVFALTYFSTTPGTLWVGGYFLNAGGVVRNSIATYNISKSLWGSVIKKDQPAVVGLLEDTDLSTDPGVVYTFFKAAIDTSNVVTGGSFRITSSKTSNILYNLIKITTSNPTENNSTEYNITSI